MGRMLLPATSKASSRQRRSQLVVCPCGLHEDIANAIRVHGSLLPAAYQWNLMGNAHLL